MSEPEMSVWTGRVDTHDGSLAVRWHQQVKPLAPGVPPGVVLLGFACDEGVRRSQGRVGAAGGPKAIRSALAHLAWHQQQPVYDAGDVACVGGDLEGAQKHLNQAVYELILAGHRPLVLGGGHETAWGVYGGLVRSVQAIDPSLRVGIINLDAHLDMRADPEPNSGTSFSQIARWCREIDRPFLYMCLGVSEASNTAALFDRAKRFGAYWHFDTELDPWRQHELVRSMERFFNMVDVLYLSIDLDVLPASVMPAVSARAARGIPVASVETMITTVFATGKVVVVDLVELSPPLDALAGPAVGTAARLAWQIAKDWPVTLAEAEESP